MFSNGYWLCRLLNEQLQKSRDELQHQLSLREDELHSTQETMLMLEDKLRECCCIYLKMSLSIFPYDWKKSKGQVFQSIPEVRNWLPQLWFHLPVGNSLSFSFSFSFSFSISWKCLWARGTEWQEWQVTSCLFPPHLEILWGPFIAWERQGRARGMWERCQFCSSSAEEHQGIVNAKKRRISFLACHTFLSGAVSPTSKRNKRNKGAAQLGPICGQPSFRWFSFSFEKQSSNKELTLKSCCCWQAGWGRDAGQHSSLLYPLLSSKWPTRHLLSKLAEWAGAL